MAEWASRKPSDHDTGNGKTDGLKRIGEVAFRPRGGADWGYLASRSMEESGEHAPPRRMRSSRSQPRRDGAIPGSYAPRSGPVRARPSSLRRHALSDTVLG